MSLDINFNKSISFEDLESKTTLKIMHHNNGKFLEDEYGNVIAIKGEPIHGITLYGGPKNPLKILDELITVFDVKFIDDEAFEIYCHEQEAYANIDLYTPTMLKYGYLLNFDGKIVIPNRKESDYMPRDKKPIKPDIEVGYDLTF